MCHQQTMGVLRSLKSSHKNRRNERSVACGVVTPFQHGIGSVLKFVIVFVALKSWEEKSPTILLTVSDSIHTFALNLFSCNPFVNFIEEYGSAHPGCAAVMSCKSIVPVCRLCGVMFLKGPGE